MADNFLERHYEEYEARKALHCNNNNFYRFFIT